MKSNRDSVRKAREAYLKPWNLNRSLNRSLNRRDEA